jgi:hypothetical protein
MILAADRATYEENVLGGAHLSLELKLFVT